MPLGEGYTPHSQFTTKPEDKGPLPTAQGTVTLWTVTQDLFSAQCPINYACKLGRSKQIYLLIVPTSKRWSTSHKSKTDSPWKLPETLGWWPLFPSLAVGSCLPCWIIHILISVCRAFWVAWGPIFQGKVITLSSDDKVGPFFCLRQGLLMQ